jgi:hypothetical protein
MSTVDKQRIAGFVSAARNGTMRLGSSKLLDGIPAEYRDEEHRWQSRTKQSVPYM